MTWIATTALALLAQAGAPESQEALITGYFAADALTEGGRKERLRIQRALAAVELASASAPRTLAGFLERSTKGRVLDKKPGQRFWWAQEERGAYIVGGQTKKPKALALCLLDGPELRGGERSALAAYERALAELGWLAIFPRALAEQARGWTEAGTEEWVLELVECALRTWRIDPDRVVLCGHSTGGHGTWAIGAHHADRFAALAPSAGAPTPLLGRSREVIGLLEGIVPNLRNLAVCVFQSSDDPFLEPAANRLAARLMGEAKALHGGYDCEYWEAPGRGHGAPPGGFEAHLARIAGRARVTHPDTVVWQPVLAWKQQFYWLWWDEPVKNSLVVARVGPEPNTVRLATTGDVRGLCVLVDPELLDPEKEIFVYANDVLAWRGIPVPDLATTLATGARGDPELAYTTKIVLP